MVQMCSPRTALNEDVVKENEHELAKEWTKDQIHESLKCCLSVGQSKRHHPKLKMPAVCTECCFLNILRVHPHLVRVGSEIELGEEVCTMKLIQ
jgi:hypothetical protein